MVMLSLDMRVGLKLMEYTLMAILEQDPHVRDQLQAAFDDGAVGFWPEDDGIGLHVDRNRIGLVTWPELAKLVGEAEVAEFEEMLADPGEPSA